MKKAIATLFLALSVSACSVTDLMTPDQLAEYRATEERLLEAEASGDDALALDLEEDLIEQEAEVTQPYVETGEALVRDFVPAGPWKPFALMGVGLLSRGLTRRGRRHLKRGAQAAAKASVPGVVSSVLAALGYGSGTSEDAQASLDDVKEKEARNSSEAASAQVIEEAVAVAMSRYLEQLREGEPVKKVIED